MQRDHFNSDGFDIAYGVEGEGSPVLLIHGFASNIEANWVNPGWVSTLVRAGYQVVAIDNRGHGRSGKSYDPADYEARFMAADAARLLDHLGIERADVMGYSMGARIAAFMAMNHPGHVRSAVFGGLGMGMVDGVGSPEPIIAGLEAESLEDVPDETGRTFRAFAEATGSDRMALAACMRSARSRISADELAKLALPVLVAVGSKDAISGSGAGLAAIIPGAKHLEIPGRDHMLAVGDKVYKQGVLDFLERRA